MAAASTPGGLSASPPLATVVPVNVQPQAGRVQLPVLAPTLVSRLAAGERERLRQSGRELRAAHAQGAAPSARQPKAWALVTAPLERHRAQRAAAQLQAVAALQRRPMRVEQWPVGARWRAVFWAFDSAQEAQKVRLALADKGLRLEVLEF